MIGVQSKKLNPFKYGICLSVRQCFVGLVPRVPVFQEQAN